MGCELTIAIERQLNDERYPSRFFWHGHVIYLQASTLATSKITNSFESAICCDLVPPAVECTA